jgi:hypothetical protein
MLSTVIFSPDFTPLGWIVIWIAGLVIGIRRRAAWVTIALLIGFHIAWTRTGLYTMFVGYERQVASARYESILLLPFAIGTALFIQAGLEARAWLRFTAAAIFIAATVGTLWHPYSELLRPFTLDYEYRFLKRYALTLPPKSRLYILQSPVQDTGFLDAREVGQFVGSSVSFEVCSTPGECENVVRDGCDAYIYIGSSCAPLVEGTRPLGQEYAQWIENCGLVRSRLASHAVEEIEVPARKMAWHDFANDTVRLGLYRVSDAADCRENAP